jgi:hypothetical protein
MIQMITIIIHPGSSLSEEEETSEGGVGDPSDAVLRELYLISFSVSATFCSASAAPGSLIHSLR